MQLLRRLMRSHAPPVTILIRLLAGSVFLSEGLQKFLYPDLLGAGRFAEIGIPAPELMAPFVAVLEIVCGLLVLAGLLTRLAVIPLVIDIVVAILSTKVPILLEHGYWIFALPKSGRYGFWAMLSESRADFSVLFSCLFLLVVGAGPWSLDYWFARLTRQTRANTIVPGPLRSGARAHDLTSAA